jgi:hypothetical protein
MRRVCLYNFLSAEAMNDKLDTSVNIVYLRQPLICLLLIILLQFVLHLLLYLCHVLWFISLPACIAFFRFFHYS